MAVLWLDGKLSSSTPDFNDASLPNFLPFCIDRVRSSDARSNHTTDEDAHPFKVDFLGDTSTRLLDAAQDVKGVMHRQGKRTRNNTGTSVSLCSLNQNTPEQRLAREVQACISKSAKQTSRTLSFKGLRYFSDDALSLDEPDAQCARYSIVQNEEAQMEHSVTGDEPDLRVEPVPLYTGDCKVPKGCRRVAVPYTITSKGACHPSQFYWSIINTRHLQRNPNKKVCCLCQSGGHSLRTCPTRACAYCGSRSHLELIKCPFSDVVCEFCTAAGHLASRCPQRLAAASIESQVLRTCESSSDASREPFNVTGRRRCLTCGRDGDSFYCTPCQKSTRSSIIRSQMWLFCSFCGSRGHTSRDCRRRRESRLLKSRNFLAPPVTEHIHATRGNLKNAKLSTRMESALESFKSDRKTSLSDSSLAIFRTVSRSPSSDIENPPFTKSLSASISGFTREELKRERKRDRRAIKAQKRQKRQAIHGRQHNKEDTRCGSRATARLCTAPMHPNRNASRSPESDLPAGRPRQRKKPNKDARKRRVASHNTTCVFPKKARCRFRKGNT